MNATTAAQNTIASTGAGEARRRPGADTAETAPPPAFPVGDLLRRVAGGVEASRLGFGSQRALTTEPELAHLIEQHRRPPAMLTGIKFPPFSLPDGCLGESVPALVSCIAPQRPKSRDRVRVWCEYANRALIHDTLVQHADKLVQVIPTYRFEAEGVPRILYNRAHIMWVLANVFKIFPGLAAAPIRKLPKKVDVHYGIYFDIYYFNTRYFKIA